MKTLLVLFFTLFVFQKAWLQPSTNNDDSLAKKIFTPAQLREDFNYLRNLLQETHPGLYRYTSKGQLQQKMDSISSLLDTEMSCYDFHLLLADLMASIRCSHTYIVPQRNIDQYMIDIKTIPFDLTAGDGKIYTILNGTRDETIKPGAELLSINGMSAAAILGRMYKYIWVDGFITTAKASQASGIRFSLFYYLYIERPDSFRLKFSTENGVVEKVVAAKPYKDYAVWYQKNPVNKSVLDIYTPRNLADRKDPWRVEYPSQGNTALMIFRNFGGGNSSEAAAKKMRDFMEKNLSSFRKKNIGNLIIDLRSNKGGWDSQGVELLKYLLKESQPFRYYKHAHTITNSREYLKLSDLSAVDLANIEKELIPKPDGTFELNEKYNDEAKEQTPARNRFNGNIYFLINGGTVSAAAEFSAVAQSHHTGTFIGIETGGVYEGSNGGSFLHFILPNSRFYAGTPLVYSENAVTSRDEKGRGTFPDHKISFSINDIITGRDPQLEFALQLIKGPVNE